MNMQPTLESSRYDKVNRVQKPCTGKNLPGRKKGMYG
jgi:hypothetical protein